MIYPVDLYRKYAAHLRASDYPSFHALPSVDQDAWERVAELANEPEHDMEAERAAFNAEYNDVSNQLYESLEKLGKLTKEYDRFRSKVKYMLESSPDKLGVRAQSILDELYK